MKSNNIKYDVALSFAGEQRNYVEQVSKILEKNYGLKVFYDKSEKEKLWGSNLLDELYKVYSKQAKYVIIFVSKEYKKKIWTNHERQATQEKALKLKNKDYILPVRFDKTQIPGLPDTIGYLDARQNSPYQVALEFAKKIGKAPKGRWFGTWERKQFPRASTGELEIFQINKEGFYFNISVAHGSHLGRLEKQHAKFKNEYEAISEINDCSIEFTMLGNNLHIQEKNCMQYHGLRAYFDGEYVLEKVFFHMFDRINDITLSKLYKILGKKCYSNYEMCFSDYQEINDNGRYILFGKIPGMFSLYNGHLILDGTKIRGFFVNCNIKSNTIFWFASDNKIDDFVYKWIEEEESGQFKEYKLEKLKKHFCK